MALNERGKLLADTLTERGSLDLGEEELSRAQEALRLVRERWRVFWDNGCKKGMKLTDCEGDVLAHVLSDVNRIRYTCMWHVHMLPTVYIILHVYLIGICHIVLIYNVLC